MSEEMMDLNDLVKSINFTVMEQNYEISPMNDTKMKSVMGLSKKITELTNITTDEESMSEEQEAELLDTQNTILHNTVSLNKEDKLLQVTKKDFADWPMKLKNKVLELVFNRIGGGGDNIEPEAEKN